MRCYVFLSDESLSTWVPHDVTGNYDRKFGIIQIRVSRVYGHKIVHIIWLTLIRFCKDPIIWCFSLIDFPPIIRTPKYCSQDDVSIVVYDISTGYDWGAVPEDMWTRLEIVNVESISITDADIRALSNAIIYWLLNTHGEHISCHVTKHARRSICHLYHSFNSKGFAQESRGIRSNYLKTEELMAVLVSDREFFVPLFRCFVQQRPLNYLFWKQRKCVIVWKQ